MARGLKFRIKEVEGLHYPCSENKDAGQLRGYRADLRPCFRICKKPVFSQQGSNILRKTSEGYNKQFDLITFEKIISNQKISVFDSTANMQFSKMQN